MQRHSNILGNKKKGKKKKESCRRVFRSLHTVVCGDRTFRDFKAAKSDDRRNLYSTKKWIHGFGGSRVVKCSVVRCIDLIQLSISDLLLLLPLFFHHVHVLCFRLFDIPTFFPSHYFRMLQCLFFLLETLVLPYAAEIASTL